MHGTFVALGFTALSASSPVITSIHHSNGSLELSVLNPSIAINVVSPQPNIVKDLNPGRLALNSGVLSLATWLLAQLPQGIQSVLVRMAGRPEQTGTSTNQSSEDFTSKTH